MLDKPSIGGKYDYCFVGSGVILNRLLLEAPYNRSRCLVISDQHNDNSYSLERNSVTILSRNGAISSIDEFEIEILVILAKTHLWKHPEDFQELIHKMRPRVRKKVIHVSSGSVYGEAITNVDESSPLKPLTAYGMRKVFEEKCVVNTFMGVTAIQVLRVSNVFGDSLFHDFTNQCIKAALDRSSVKVYSNGNIVRDYLFVNCLVEALSKLIVWNPTEEYILLNLSTGIGTSITELINFISEETGLNINKTNHTRPVDLAKRSVLDNSVMLRTIPWKPLNMETGMKYYLKGFFRD
jgi:UDP-glucose 4-epimerase